MVIYLDDRQNNRDNAERISAKYPEVDFWIYEYQEDVLQALPEIANRKDVILISDWSIYPKYAENIGHPINPLGLLSEATRLGIKIQVVTDGHTDFIPNILERNGIVGDVTGEDRFLVLENIIKEQTSHNPEVR